MNTETIEFVDVCVIGGGIAGLGLAIALQQSGYKVLVLERDSHANDRKQGYGLTLTNSLTGPLSKLGLLDECITKNCLSKSHFTFDSMGNILGYFGRSLKADKDNTTQGGSRGNLRIPRHDLRSMMINRLEGNVLRWGSKVIDYQESSEEVNIQIESEGLGTYTIKSYVLVGADGIRSKIRQLYDQNNKVPSGPPIRYLNIAVILGISSISHPLLQDKGYYAIDGQQRLFTMPFYTPPNEAKVENGEVPLIMWQLSFAQPDEDAAKSLRDLSPDQILTYALEKTKDWFPAVNELLANTLPGDAWATPLYDRDAMTLKAKHQGSRVTFIGDAAHPMSMFKGQGANQALEDGPLLVDWLNNKGGAQKRKHESNLQEHEVDSILKLANLSQSTIFTRLRNFEREMIAKTSIKVLASREAAGHLHSPAILSDFHGISGLSEEFSRKVLSYLYDNKITANTKVNNLDHYLFEIVQQLESNDELKVIS